jgi:hypothetical protein
MKRMGRILGSWLLIGIAASWAQEPRKAGLWLIETSTRIQQQGEAPGNFSAQENGAKVDSTGGLPVCLTRQLVDNYGIILPPSLKDCELSNVLQTADSFKADMTCKGGYNGFGSVESKWTDPDHVVGKVRFVSRTRETTDARALTWTQESAAVFKSSDCGAVKPRRMPADKVPSK